MPAFDDALVVSGAATGKIISNGPSLDVRVDDNAGLGIRHKIVISGETTGVPGRICPAKGYHCCIGREN